MDRQSDAEPGVTSLQQPKGTGQRLAAILLMCGAVFCFAGLDACAKWASREAHPLLTTWFRYAANVGLVAIFLNGWTQPRLLHSNRFGLQVARSILLCVSTLLNFLALQHLQLTQTISIQFAMPLLVALMAGPILGEWAGPRRLVAIAVGFCGVLVITRPLSGSLHPAVLFSIANTILYAVFAIVTRILAAHDSTATTLTYSGLAGVVMLTPVLPFVWTTPSSPLMWGVMIGTGFFGAVGHGLLILAHARAPAPVLSPFIYTQIVWMTLLGFVLFGELPDLWTFVGAAIVIGSGLYLLLWERSRARQAS